MAIGQQMLRRYPHLLANRLDLLLVGATRNLDVGSDFGHESSSLGDGNVVLQSVDGSRVGLAFHSVQMPCFGAGGIRLVSFSTSVVPFYFDRQ
jgi:hypothetical protein